MKPTNIILKAPYMTKHSKVAIFKLPGQHACAIFGNIYLNMAKCNHQNVTDLNLDMHYKLQHLS